MNAETSAPPFPRSAAVSIEASAGPSDVSMVRLRTWDLPGYAAARQVFTSYLTHYRQTTDGAAVGIRGEFGSGKTHLIWQLMNHTVTLCASPQSVPAIEPIQVYAKALSSDFMEVYRTLLGYLGRNQMTRAHIGVLSSAARQLASKQDGIGVATIDVLKEHPERIINLLRDTLLSESDVVATAASALHGEKSRYTDFFSAFTFLNDPHLQDVAFKWFSGEPLEPQSYARLGVSSPITEANVVVALQFLSLMFSFAGIPLLVYIDQIERLVMDTDAERSKTNRGRLHSLIEACITNRNALVVAGVSKAWDTLPLDFIQRFSIPPITMPTLDVEQTRAIIALYLAKDVAEVPRPPDVIDDSHVAPFTARAIEEIVKISHGNIRAILSLCSNAFELTPPPPSPRTISPDLVQKAAEKLQRSYNRVTVLDEVCELLRGADKRYERNVEFASDLRPDVVVPGGTHPQAMIDVMEPVFLEDEARDAHRYIAAISRARARFSTVRFVLIDVGYRSPQVKDLLLTPIDFYIRYDPQTFRSEFKGTIEAMATSDTPLTVPRPDGELEGLKKTIEDLRELVLSRTAQQSALDERIAAIISLQPKHVVNISGGVSTQANEENSSQLSSFLSLRGWLAVGASAAVLLALILMMYFHWQLTANQRRKVDASLELARSESEARSNEKLSILSALAMPPVSAPTWMLDARLKFNGRQSLLGLLAHTEAAPEAARLFDYYRSVSLCLSGGSCDLATSCNDVVPEILSLERSVALYVGINTYSERQMALQDSLQNRTDADRLLNKCARIVPQDLLS